MRCLTDRTLGVDRELKKGRAIGDLHPDSYQSPTPFTEQEQPKEPKINPPEGRQATGNNQRSGGEGRTQPSPLPSYQSITPTTRVTLPGTEFAAPSSGREADDHSLAFAIVRPGRYPCWHDQGQSGRGQRTNRNQAELLTVSEQIPLLPLSLGRCESRYPAPRGLEPGTPKWRVGRGGPEEGCERTRGSSVALCRRRRSTVASGQHTKFFLLPQRSKVLSK